MFFLQLRGELWKLFGKKRTYIGFTMFLIAQNIIVLVFRFTGAIHRMIRLLEMNGFYAQEFVSIQTITTIMMVVMVYTLLPLYAALVGGDLVAKEAEDGTLRMILSRPISRFRLLFIKWLAGAIFSFLLVLSLGMFGLLFSSFWFPSGSLFVAPPLTFATFSPTDGLGRYLLAQLFLVPKACTVMTLGFMFSCFNMKPAAATILALSVMFISEVLERLPFFNDYLGYLISYQIDVLWTNMIAPHIAWWEVGEMLSFLIGYNLTFLVIGFTAFQMRDIKS